MGSNAAAATTTTVSNKGPAVAAPTAFTGDRKTTEKFLFECSLVIDARPDDYKTDEAKKALVLSYMKNGTAGTWALKYHRDRVKAKEAAAAAGTAYVEESYKKFIEKVAKEFQEIDKGRAARHKLTHIKQGRFPADSYIALFNSYAHETDFNETALIEFFKNGLRYDLLKRIEEMENIPTTLELWQTKAAQFDMSKNFSRQPNYNYNPGPSNWKQGTRENPIMIDALQKVVAKLSDSERNELRRKGLCFYCKEGGHISRNCPKKKPFKARKTSAPENISVNAIMELLPEADYDDLLMAIHERNQAAGSRSDF